MSTFSDFLSRNNITLGGVLPLVHSTRAYHLKGIVGSNKIIATPCDVFTPEMLSYFFVGRLAYKYREDSSEAEYWELPCCFIFDFTSVCDIRRVFPFDSGAFHRNRYPGYINQMSLAEFEASSAPETASRIIGAFFGDVRSYFALKSRNQNTFETEFSLGVFDAEIKALHRLAREKAPASFDDRRFSIEIQSSSDIDLQLTKPLAVVAPAPYFDDINFLDHVQNKWTAVPLPYPVYSLSVGQYYHAIYERVETFFKTKGLL
jgi:hypothetical protein